MSDLNALSPSAGVSSPMQVQEALVRVSDQIRTDNDKQLQANSVTAIQEDGSSVKAEVGSNEQNQIKVEELLRQRSTLFQSETGAEAAAKAVTEKINKAQAAAALQRSLINIESTVRDSGADTTAQQLDVSA